VYKILPALMIALLATHGHAQVYKHVDEEGNVTFTDAPPPDAQPVEIGPTNTAPPPAAAYPKAPADKPKTGGGGNYSLSITAPAHEQIFHGGGIFTVSASVSPSLGPNHQLQLFMNGAPRGEPQGGASWPLTNVSRGEQVLEVAVVDADGKEIARSKPVTVFVFRPSTGGSRPPRPTPRN
jgi:hypothetical protein